MLSRNDDVAITHGDSDITGLAIFYDLNLKLPSKTFRRID